MSTTQIRQRTTPRPSSTTNTTKNNNYNMDRREVQEPGTGLNAKQMIDSAPQQHGTVLKLHIPILYSILPQFIKNIILSFSFLSKFLGPSWKQRYLILCGSYLYKFNDETSPVPKGAPFDVETLAAATSTTTGGGDDEVQLSEFASIPPGYTAIFTVSTLRRKHYYAVSSRGLVTSGPLASE